MEAVNSAKLVVEKALQLEKAHAASLQCQLEGPDYALLQTKAHGLEAAESGRAIAEHALQQEKDISGALREQLTTCRKSLALAKEGWQKENGRHRLLQDQQDKAELQVMHTTSRKDQMLQNLKYQAIELGALIALGQQTVSQLEEKVQLPSDIGVDLRLSDHQHDAWYIVQACKPLKRSSSHFLPIAATIQHASVHIRFHPGSLVLKRLLCRHTMPNVPNLLQIMHYTERKP